MTLALVIPALDEAETLPAVLAAIPAELPLLGVVVVDGGSRDGTREVARLAGATVVLETRRGYGRACMSGAAEAERLGAGAVAFMDAGGAEDPADLAAVAGPVLRGEADLVLGSRVLGARQPGALRPLQRGGNWLATRLIQLRHGHRYTDLGSMRAIGLAELGSLGMREMAHGWPAEMQVRALRAGLRIREVPIRYRRRRGGRSKVSGSFRGALRAGAAILRVVLAS